MNRNFSNTWVACEKCYVAKTSLFGLNSGIELVWINKVKYVSEIHSSKFVTIQNRCFSEDVKSNLSYVCCFDHDF